MLITGGEESLINLIMTNYSGYDAIVVEGYDNVGKGRVLNILSKALDVVPYRPDYNLWQKYDHRPQDRWKVSAFFWDIYSHFNLPIVVGYPMLFDRGVLSGAVYNNDMRIAQDYLTIIRGKKILHVLVQCSREDYIHFYLERNPTGHSIAGAELTYSKYLEFNKRYEEAIEESHVDYIIYLNQYDPRIATHIKDTCEGCGHYAYGWCRHPQINKEVESSSKRCGLSNDMEVQDVSEMSEL